MTPLPMSSLGDAFVFWLIYAFWIWRETIFASDPTRLGASEESSPSEGENRDRGSRRFLMIVLFAGIVIGFSSAFLLPGATIVSHRVIMFWIGIALMLAGIVLRQTAIRTLGRYFTFTVRVREQQPVIDFGPYKYIRHPSYTGGLLTLAGVGLCLTNGASLCVILLGAAIGYGYRIPVEEQALCEALGEAYRAYMRRTKRLVPFVL